MQHAAEDQEGAGEGVRRNGAARAAVCCSLGADLASHSCPTQPLTHSARTTHPSQIAYVLGTEDFFHRRRAQRAARDKAARAAKFQAWCAAKAPAPAAPAPAAAAAAPPPVAAA